MNTLTLVRTIGDVIYRIPIEFDEDNLDNRQAVIAKDIPAMKWESVVDDEYLVDAGFYYFEEEDLVTLTQNELDEAWGVLEE